jgi:hypothetical protein
MARFDQNHVASPLAHKTPTILDKSIKGRSSADGGKPGHGLSGDGDFHKPGFHGERHSLLCPDLQATKNGLMDVCSSLVPGCSLTDATGDGRAFGDPHAVFVAFQCDDEFHGGKLASGDWFGQFFEVGSM